MSTAVPHATQVTREEVARRIAFADAALAVAGHQVTDPVVNELARQVAAEQLTEDEAVRLAMAHIDSL